MLSETTRITASVVHELCTRLEQIMVSTAAIKG